LVRTEEWLKPFWETLRDLLLFFRSTRFSHVIIGGVAVSLVGKPRATQDIDGLVLLKGDRQEEFFKKVLDSNFSPRISDAIEFARRRRVLLLQHRNSGIKVDLSFADLPFQEEVFKRKKIVIIDGMKIPIPTPEDIIIMKAVAHRPRDIADIEGLLDLHSSLDLKRVRCWVKEFSKVLEMPEIHSDLEKLIRRSGPAKVRRRSGRK